MGMTRDWDLTRRIMLDVVDKTDYGGDPGKVIDQLAKEIGEAKVMLHVSWLVDEGLLEADRLSATFGGPSYPQYIVNRVTASGQAFVQAVASSTGWKGFLSRIAELAREGARISIPVVLELGLRQFGR